MFTVFPRYVLSRLLPWAAVCWIGAAAITMTTQLLRTAPILGGAGIALAAKTIVLLFVPLSAFAMTPAILAAVLITAAKMKSDDEILGADACGIDRGRVQLLLTAAALIAAIVNGFLWWTAAPVAVRSVRESAVNHLRMEIGVRLTPGRFHHPASGVAFFADERGEDGMFKGVFVTGRTDVGAFEAAAESARLVVTESEARLRLYRGRLFSDGGAGDRRGGADAAAGAGGLSNPVAVTFGQFDFQLPLEEILGDRLDFLPAVLCASGEELMGPPENGVLQWEWDYALYRRLAAPVGFFLLTVFGIRVAFGGRGWGRAVATGTVAGTFLIYHAAGRLGETLASEKTLSASGAAFLPVAAAVLILVGEMLYSALRSR